MHTCIHAYLHCLKCMLINNYLTNQAQILYTQKPFDLKEGIYRDGIKRKETRQGWMDGCCHGDNRYNPTNQQPQALFIVIDTIWSAVTIYVGHVPVDY